MRIKLRDYKMWYNCSIQIRSIFVFFFAFIPGLFCFSAFNASVYADTYSASLSGTGSVNIGLTGEPNTGTADSTITASTTCPNGYTISINGTDDEDVNDYNLYLDGDDANTNKRFSLSSGALANPTALGANSWGILVSNNLYSGISETPVAWVNATAADYTPGVNKDYTFTYGASHDGSLAAGTYTMANNGRVVYTLEMDNTCTSYTVAFDANEPTGADPATGTMANQTITEGVATPLTANAFEVTGYTFTGWNTEADGSGTNYANEASVTNLTAANTTITLYAQWALNIIQNYAGCPYLSVGEEVLLTDIRDGKTYWVAKMADGHCWMTQNLDLDLETAPSKVTALTSENTDLNSYGVSGYTSEQGYSQDTTTGVITWTPVRPTATVANLDASNWATSSDFFSNYSFDPGAYYYTDTFQTSLGGTGYNYLVETNENFIKTTPYAGNDVHGHVGNYYTWSAAVASNDTSGHTASTYTNVGNNPQNSICPAGWRLPLTTSAQPTYTSPDTLNEVGRLNYVLNNNTFVTNSSLKLEASPFYMTRAGYVDVGGVITRAGRGSGIWTSTVSSRTDSKTLYESSSQVNAPSDSDRNGGYPVRCISKDQAATYYEITFQANEPAGAGTATGSMSNQSILSGTTATLNHNNYELAGYIFSGWNTAANGTGTAYANEGSITPASDMILYAQWVKSYALTYDFGDESFDGASILNTNVALFDANTVDKNFTVSFGIGAVTPVTGQSDDFNTLAAAMSEANQSYPGFVARYKASEANTGDKANKYKFVANATTNNKYDSGTTYFDNANGAVITRKSGLMYLNNGTNPVMDFNTLAAPFNTPLTFGAGLNGSNLPFRYANVELSDINVTIDYAYSDTVTLPAPTKTNDTFLFWNTAADGQGTTYSAGSTITMSDSLTLYPMWQSDAPVATHSVTFDVNAPSGAPTPTGTMANQTVADNVSTKLNPNTYAINGYAFTGWNTAADGQGTPYADEASVTLTADLTLYAQWTLVAQHTLTFDFGNESFGGSTYIDTKIKLFSSELISKDFVLSFGLANQVFLTGQNGNFNNLANAMYESGAYPGFVVRVNSGNVTNNQYNFNANAKSGVTANSNVPNATSTGFKLERKSGHAYLNNSQTAAIDFNQITSPFDTPLTFGAGLNGSSQPFRYSKVDLSNIKLVFTFNNTDTYTLPSPTKTNDTFLYWNTAADGTGTTYNAGATVTMSDDLTLYPIWLSSPSITTYSVTFLPNTPTGAPTPSGTMTSQSVVEDMATKLDPNAYAINGYAFTGWNTSADGLGTPYADEASVTLTADLTLYAQWVQVAQHTLTYNFGDESFDGSNYLDTNIKLFSSALNSKDFDLSLSMGDATFIANSDNLDNIVTAMSEAGQPYPGFVVRYGSSNNLITQYTFIANSSTASADKKTRDKQNNNSGFRVRRINGQMYLNSETSPIVDFNHLANTFDSPLLFGAGLDKNNQLFRYSKIDLSNISLTITFNNTDTVTLPTPVKPLYTFTEWNTAVDGTGTGYSAGDTVTMSSDLTLYPIWQSNGPIVTFNKNNANATGTMSPQSITPDVAMNLNANQYTLTGYEFAGWNTNADGVSGTDYADEESVTLSDSVTLYAKWTPLPSYDNNYREINLNTPNRSNSSTATIDLSNVDGGIGSTVTYTSADTSVATVDSSGLVTAVGAGETTIYVDGSNKKLWVNVYVSEPNVPLFNITPEPIQVYYNSRDAWDTTKTKADFLANVRETFENYHCKIYNYTDNSGRLDSAIAYGWTDGTNYCDQSRAYDTGETGALNVYLYDTANSQPTGNALSYTGASAGKIYNMIPGETYYWELASDTSVNGLVKATGKHRILNFTQGDYSRVSGSQITRNTREIGGLPVDTDYNGTIDGYTNYGRIFRGERLWTSNGYNTTKLSELGANYEIDVRSSGEGSTDSRLANYSNRTVVQYQIKQGVDTGNYNTMRNVVTQTMQNVINGDNIYFHCSYGSDRTGSLAWILEGLLGVTDEARLSDYELSTFYGAVDRNRYFEYEGSNTKRFTYMMTFLKTGQDVYDWYMYGSSDRAADAVLINDFRTAMVSYSAIPQENTPQNQSQNQIQSQITPEQNEPVSQAADSSSEPETEDDSQSSETTSNSEPQSSESGHAEPLGVTTSTKEQVSQASDENNQDSANLALAVGLLAVGTVTAAAIGITRNKSEE